MNMTRLGNLEICLEVVVGDAADAVDAETMRSCSHNKAKEMSTPDSMMENLMKS